MGHKSQPGDCGFDYAVTIGGKIAPRFDGAIPLGITEVVRSSWERCSSVHRLMRTNKDGPSVLTRPELKALAEPLDDLSRIARPEITELLKKLSPVNYVVVLSDPDGVALEVQASMPIDKALNRMGVCAGATWGEPHVGTNGIGTSIAYRRPVIVHRHNHFLLRYDDLTCTAAPLFDSSGRVIGALDASSVANFSSEIQSFILERVVRTARRIERSYFLAQNRNNHVVSIRPSTEGVTSGRFMLALADDGRAIDFLAESNMGERPEELAALIGRRFSDFAEAKWQDGSPAHDRSASNERVGILRFEGKDVPYFVNMRFPQKHGRKPSVFDAEASENTNRIVRKPASGVIGLDGLAGRDPSMLSSVATIRRLADRRLPILLQGETGTGKEEFARGIHADSSRAGKPFVAIDCSSLPESLVESELFGYESGTFTGARREGRSGRILDANGGTLFLDEIGDMPVTMQTRLLRVLAQNEVVPLGSGKAIPVDFALISASHQNLTDMIADGRFRRDLYYRIAGVRVILPALRDRQDKRDCILSALEIEAAASPAGTCAGLAPDALAILLTHTWPGNMRELRLIMRYALAAADNDVITIAHLPSWLEASTCMNQYDPHAAPMRLLPERSTLMTPQARLRDVLARHNGCISDAAAELEVSRQTIYRWLRKANLDDQDPEL